MIPIAFGPPSGKDLGNEEDEVEITFLDPRYSKGPIRVKEESNIGKPSSSVRPPGGVAANLFGSNDAKSVRSEGSPAPTQQSAPTDLGPDDLDGYDPGDGQFPGDGGGPGDGNDGLGGRGGDPPSPPDPPNGPDGDKGKKVPKDNKPKGGSGPPDVGDGGNDPDPNEDDDDEKFRRRMIKFLGGFVDPKTDDKPKVKEADTIKIPAFPLAETYRNWRIKTREAIVAASTDPDIVLSNG